jgi:hypothetical protein
MTMSMYLDAARQGKHAAGQIIRQMENGCVTDAELRSLMKKVVAGYEELLPELPPVLEADRISRGEGLRVMMGRPL